MKSEFFKRLLVTGFFLCGIPLYAQEFYLGVDLSYVNQLEDCGVVYYDENNTETDVYDLLSGKGANLVRYRLWHNPDWTNYSNYDDVKSAITRAKAADMQVLLDFHYSDFWADPSRQWRPAAWNSITDDAVLGDSVYNYTYKTLNNLAAEGLLPDMVQIGNEINCNILIQRTTENIDDSSPSSARYPINWTRQISLLHKGIEAVQQINAEQSDSIKTVIHVAQPENAEWWFADAVSNGLTGFDIIGLSYYPQWSDYDIRGVGDFVKQMKDTYNKDVMIVETGYPWTASGEDGAGNVLGNDSKMETYGNTLSNDNQRDLLIELTYLIKENGGLGIVYWEPAWVSSSCQTYWGTGSHYENAALFDFDNKINSGADFLSYDYNNLPPGLADQNVMFIVDMYGIETGNGVFVTGSFTGESWTFESMSPTENDLYEVTVSIPGRTVGGYIFYNNNEWNNSYKETVPSQCALMWDTHRKYVITNTDAEYAYSWSKCSLVEHSSVLNTNEKDALKIYPSPANKYLNIIENEDVKSIQAANIYGQKFPLEYSDTGKVNIQCLEPGLYVLLIETGTAMHSYSFVKL